MKKSVFALMVMAACASNDLPVDEQLGIQELVIDEGAKKLEVSGLDKTGAVIAKVSIELGRFEVEEHGWVDKALHMKVDVRGKGFEHTSAGDGLRELPSSPHPSMRDINSFLLNEQVAQSLRRWNMSVAPPEVDASALFGLDASRETGFAACNPAPHPTQCAPIECIQVDYLASFYEGCWYQGVKQGVCCNGTSGKKATTRLCGYGPPYSWSPCGQLGANGCVVCTSTNWSSWCDVYTYAANQLCSDGWGGGYNENWTNVHSYGG